MMIDAHVHFGLGDGLTGPWDTNADIRRYLQRAAAVGISRAVLLPAFTSDYARANRALAAHVASSGGRFIGFAMLHPEADRTRAGALVAEAVRLGLRGLKVHRHDAPLNRQICEAARQHRLPILYDPVGELGGVELAAQEYPDVPLIIAHLGSFADDWKAQRDCIAVLKRHANVHADTSGVRRFDLLLEALQAVGPARLVFGSDGPFLHPGVELAKVRMLGLSAEALAQVCGGNLLRLLKGGARTPPVHRPIAPAATAAFAV